MNDPNGSRVAVLIDYENVFIEFGKKVSKEEQINWEAVLQAAKGYGSSLICKAYADWSGNWTKQDKLSKIGIQPVTVPSKRIGKNGVDVKMAVDALDMLIVKNTNIGSLVLVSGDGDFTPLVHYLKDFGKLVVGIGIQRATAEYLVSACHEFKYLVKNSELVDANQKTFTDQKEPPPAVMEPSPAVAESAREPEEQQDQLGEVRDAADGTEQLVKEYLEILHKNRILIEPTENRHYIIKKSYWILKTHGGKRFVDIKEKITNYFDKNKPGIDKGNVNESIQQISKAGCLDYDNQLGDSALPSPLWERNVYLKSWIDTPITLMRTIDRLLCEIIKRETAPKEINCEALSTVLYGTAQKPKLVEQVRRLVNNTNQPTPN